MSRRARKPWSKTELEQASEWHAKGMTYAGIGERLERSSGAIKSKLQQEIYDGVRASKFIHQTGDSAKASQEMLDARDVRRAAERSRDLTAELCGDPPKGFSALDLLNDSMRKSIAAVGDESL
jgi:hypothetical protein